ncbi:cobyrinate a,c-diamide synthase [Ohtaekwangia koreensis]|uniref:Cobyrinic acid a,c-diamide synthase n=1 Tax=Ohtaekwangia koreensis TaxID=688867 RepID=A0A1T5J4Z9_9BACT|nr:cobyrinate a,c-diamide synthase [Ohtaekwangia koreensis]SKC46454.1 cobyrinic acid a,c-diamide synthase [Ohtaekwangia koreensis]
MKYHFLVSAPSSNSGKTTVTLGLIKLFKEKGMTVQVFKCGPDYIDTKFLSQAAQRPAINLDTFMMSPDHVKDLYQRYSDTADVSIIEGVMGLFDGSDRMQGSSAEIAILLDVPVILVLPTKASAYSVAPILYGFKNFDPRIKIAGVIFNHVNTISHYNFLKDSAADVGVPCFGFVPGSDEIKIPSRHLGLTLESNGDAIIQKIAAHISKTVSLDTITETCLVTDRGSSRQSAPVHTERSRLKIAIAHDAAFTFTYHENIEVLNRRYDVVFFSPLEDSSIPEADILYLAGGYPELFLDRLSANISMKQSLAVYCDNGGKVLAECGGIMYLGNAIIDSSGKPYDMSGVLDLQTSMAERVLTLGYRKFALNNEIYCGHEFHYSALRTKFPIAAIGDIRNAKDEPVKMKVYRYKNVIASYMHFYWGDKISFIEEIFQI